MVVYTNLLEKKSIKLYRKLLVCNNIFRIFLYYTIIYGYRNGKNFKTDFMGSLLTVHSP